LDADLISGVIAAADPARVSEARLRLAKLREAPLEGGFQSRLTEVAGASQVGANSANDLIAGVMAQADVDRVAAATAKLAGMEPGDAAKLVAREKVLKQFESTLLANSLESIMPKSQDRLAGGGTAGEIWRGQQIQFMSEAMAEASPLGLANLFGDGPAQPLQLANVPPAGSARIKPFAFGGQEGQS
jgi:hypothetical protein